MCFRISNQRWKPSHPTVIMDNIPLTVVSKQCYLVSDLVASCHKVCKSMLLRICITYLSIIKEDVLKTLTESLVLSHLTYSLTVWGPSLPNYLLQWIKCMQNQAVCLCNSLHMYEHVSHYHSSNLLLFKLLDQDRHTFHPSTYSVWLHTFIISD